MFVDCCSPNLKAAALCARRQAMKQKYKRTVMIDLKMNGKETISLRGHYTQGPTLL